MAIVYLHKRKDNKEVFYVGIGKEKKRAFVVENRSNIWKRYINKHEYFVEILIEDISWKEACEIEKELIRFYGRRDLGFGELLNLTDGGDGSLGRKHTDEAKKKIGKSSKERNSSKKAVDKIKKKCIRYSLSNDFEVEYESIKDASINTYIDTSSISKACKNKRKTAGGFIWKYKN